MINQPTKLGLILVPIVVLVAIMFWHHRPASNSIEQHFPSREQAQEAADDVLAQLRTQHSIQDTRTFLPAYRSDSMGWGMDTSYIAVGYRSKISEMEHGDIGIFRSADGRAIIHRYAKLAPNIYSVAGDANKAPDERITDKNHEWRIVFIALFPRDEGF